jgi:N-hydroxyarylamine O-acetyltransferase
MSDEFQPNLEAYFARIGYTGERTPTFETLDGILVAHTARIPFENLDVLLGRGINLDPVAVEKKLIHDQRGGYCFEQNSHLLRVLSALGFNVTPLSARVRAQRPRDFIPPRTHLFLRVDIDGVSWMVDAGMGATSLTSPIRYHIEGEQPTRHEPRRFIKEDGKLFYQIRYGTEWQDVFEYTGEAMPPIDRELANWFTSAHPHSHFRNRLIVARATTNGRISYLDRELTHRRKDGTSDKREITSPDELLDVLEENFGLRFPAGTRFGPPGSPWPS